jgi:hypothetical protein
MMSPHPIRVRRGIAAATALLATGCGEGLAAPEEAGTIVVQVRDEQAAPVPGATVRVQLPNRSGGVFEVGSTTRADGTWTLTAVPAGARRVTVTPPPGYAPGPEPLARVVAVSGGQTVSADFVLRRGTGVVGHAR